MKQNPDCMRDVLLQIEEQQAFDCNNVLRPLPSDDLFGTGLTELYEESEIVYSVKQLAGSGLIEARPRRTVRGMAFDILDITPEGHQFLNNTRTTRVWTETKKRAKKIGSFALDVLSKIAAEIILSKIN